MSSPGRDTPGGRGSRQHGQASDAPGRTGQTPDRPACGPSTPRLASRCFSFLLASATSFLPVRLTAQRRAGDYTHGTTRTAVPVILPTPCGALLRFSSARPRTQPGGATPQPRPRLCSFASGPGPGAVPIVRYSAGRDPSPVRRPPSDSVKSDLTKRGWKRPEILALLHPSAGPGPTV